MQRRQQDGLPRYYASKDPQLAPLVTLMQQDSALVRTLRETLEKLDGIEVALVFGSVARGQATANSPCSARACISLRIALSAVSSSSFVLSCCIAIGVAASKKP